MPSADSTVSPLQAAVPGARIEVVPSTDGQTTIYVDRESVEAASRVLGAGSDFHRRRLRMKVRLPGNDAHVATVTGVWPAANWLEREVWDLFGIVFDGHPDPRRLLMPEDWDGHPLRKDYPVQIRQRVRADEPLQVSEDEFRATLQRDRQARR